MLEQPIKGQCQECGCTDNDCRQCIERTGKPCAWANDDHTLCTACDSKNPIPKISDIPMYVTEISHLHGGKLAPIGKIYIKVIFKYLMGFHRYVRLIRKGSLPQNETERKEYFDEFYRSSLEKTREKLETASREEEQ